MQAPIDLLGIVAIVLSMYCVLMKVPSPSFWPVCCCKSEPVQNPYAGWASLFSVVISIANTKYSEAETKSNLSTLMYAFFFSLNTP